MADWRNRLADEGYEPGAYPSHDLASSSSTLASDPDPLRDLPGYVRMRVLKEGRTFSPEMDAKLAEPAHSDVLKGVLPFAQELAGRALSSLPPEAQMALNFATRRGSSALPALPPDRTLDALRYHLRQIGHDEGGWSSRLGKAAFAASPTAASAAFYPLIASDPRYAAWAAPAMLGASAATSLLSAATQLAPHYRMLMDKRDYLRAMDKRQAERATADAAFDNPAKNGLDTDR